MGTAITSAAAIHHTLVLGLSFTLLNMRTSQKLPHISGGTDFWAYVDCDVFGHLSIITP
jgi:hypothetical protein